MELGLKDKVAIITGGSEGIGRASALRLSEEVEPAAWTAGGSCRIPSVYGIHLNFGGRGHRAVDPI